MKPEIKNKTSISQKLFIITAVMFAAFVGITLIVQSIFFQQFYKGSKKKWLEGNVASFVGRYNKTSNLKDTEDLIIEYEETYNIKIIILNYMNNNQLITRPPGGRFEVFMLRGLSDYITEWSRNPENLSNLKQANKPVLVSMQRQKDLPGNIIDITPDNEKNSVIFAMASLQPISEAVSVIKQFYVYFCIGAVFFIIILALIYSNMIAKPLIKISKSAAKMAKLDFSHKCSVKSTDEIGSVAASLNFLSGNLENALNSLKQANAKLEEDIEKERSLEKMRKEFVAAVSHELKTPITLIDGYASALKDNIFEEKERDYYLDIITDEAKKMGELVSDMLDLSHLESGIFKLKRDEFNLTELIRLTLKKYGALMKEKQISLETELLNNLKVYGDWMRLEQVITNFITNAIKNVDEEGRIYVRMLNLGHSVSIEIENTGSRISEQELPKVWDKFYKVDKSRQRKLGGTGIGLSIVKDILSLHGYSYGVCNTDIGVKFYFIVPESTY